MTTVIVVPVYRNADTLGPLHARLGGALAGTAWRLRLVIDGSPDESAAVARALAARDDRVAVTELAVNGGQHAAIVRGLAAEADGDAWVVLDADLQDPPEAVPALLSALAGGADVVFAGRRGAYESRGRRLTGDVHRRLASMTTGLPVDAGAFLAVTARGRAAIVAGAARGAPSVVIAAGVARLPAVSVPVERAPRPVGASAWTARARASQSARSLWWAVRSGSSSRTAARSATR